MSEHYIWTVEGCYRQAFDNARKNQDLVKRRSAYTFSNYENWLPDLSSKEVLQLLQQDNQQRLDAEFDLAQYPELIGMREMVAAEWQGAKEGADLTEAEAVAYCNGISYYSRHLRDQIFCKNAKPAVQDSGKCTYVYFPDSEYGPLLANNLDSSDKEPFMAPSWAGINEHLLFGGVSSGVFLDEAPHLFPAPMKKLVARYCRSVPEATELLDRYREFWGPTNVLLVDRQHRIAMIEKSARRIGIRTSENGFGFITSMTAEEPTFREYLDNRREESLRVRGMPKDNPDSAYWAEADHRRNLIKELLPQHYEKPTLEGLRSIIQHRSEKGRVAYHHDKFPHGATSGYTLRSSIWILREKRALWWAKDGDTPSYEAPVQEVSYPGVFGW